jgi:hypothetical protein
LHACIYKPLLDLGRVRTLALESKPGRFGSHLVRRAF